MSLYMFFFHLQVYRTYVMLVKRCVFVKMFNESILHSYEILETYVVLIFLQELTAVIGRASGEHVHRFFNSA